MNKNVDLSKVVCVSYDPPDPHKTRNETPLGHIILTHSRPVLALLLNKAKAF